MDIALVEFLFNEHVHMRSFKQCVVGSLISIKILMGSLSLGLSVVFNVLIDLQKKSQWHIL